MTYQYHQCCVEWDSEDVFRTGGLSDLIADRIQISRRTFRLHADADELRDLEDNLGYADHPSRGLTMAADWHVEYFRSRWHGRRVYGFRHSDIEYVFTKEPDA